jgi:hypothetical protein
MSKYQTLSFILFRFSDSFLKCRVADSPRILNDHYRVGGCRISCHICCLRGKLLAGLASVFKSVLPASLI